MIFLLTPAVLEKSMSLSEVQSRMTQDIRNAAGSSGDVDFVAVKGAKVGGAPMSLFAITDDTRRWEKLLVPQKPAALLTGKCSILKGDKITIAIKSSSSGSREAAAELANSALKEPRIQAIDFEEIASDRAPGAARSTKGADMARRSAAQARQEGRSDRGFELDDTAIKNLSRTTQQIPEYRKFADALTAMTKKYNLQGDAKLPTNIWNSLLQGLYRSGYFKDDIPQAQGARGFVLAYSGPDGRVVREKLLAKAMEGLKKFVDHAATYLDKVVAEVTKSASRPTWSFWSGTGAKDAAQAENQGGIVLEGTVGAWFDKVWDFKPLTGVENLVLWASLSELYASKAAEYYEKFSFRGYVGPGATREQSVFNKIEQPTFLDVLNVKKKVDSPHIDWFVVDCKQEGGRWVWTRGASARCTDRKAALASVQQRYGG